MIKRPSVEERQKTWEAFLDEERKLLLTKGADYTAGRKDIDAYHNFRVISHLLAGAPITPFTVAMVYFLKHVLSVITYAISGRQESGEGLAGRFHDIRNYAFILNELVGDHEDDFNFEADMIERARNVLGVADPEFPHVLGADGVSYLDAAGTWRPLSDLREYPVEDPPPRPPPPPAPADYNDTSAYSETLARNQQL